MNVVYIKHFENGKKYVGITKDFRRRMRQHDNPKLHQEHLPLYKAIKKHPHYTEIVFESNLYGDVIHMEKVIIRNFKDLGIKLYNLTEGGEGTVGYKHSEEAIQKTREKNSGEKSSKANPKEWYEINPTRRDKFKRTCKRMGWEYLSFKEMFSGEYYIDTNGGKERKYFYLFLGDNNLVDFDWSTSKNRPKEYYVSNPVLKSSFKTSCEIQGWNVGDFEEVFSGEYYHFKNINRKIKKYFYIYKGGRDDK